VGWVGVAAVVDLIAAVGFRVAVLTSMTRPLAEMSGAATVHILTTQFTTDGSRDRDFINSGGESSAVWVTRANQW